MPDEYLTNLTKKEIAFLDEYYIRDHQQVQNETVPSSDCNIKRGHCASIR